MVAGTSKHLYCAIWIIPVNKLNDIYNPLTNVLYIDNNGKMMLNNNTIDIASGVDWLFNAFVLMHLLNRL